MTVAYILIGIAALVGIFWLFRSVTNFYQTKYGTNPIGFWLLFLLTSAAIAIPVGWAWRLELIKKHGDVLNGTLVMITGIAVILFIFGRNFKIYDVRLGILTTLLQMFAMLFFPAIAVAAFYIFAIALAASSSDEDAERTRKRRLNL
jgi:hypothetical protein